MKMFPVTAQISLTTFSKKTDNHNSFKVPQPPTLFEFIHAKAPHVDFTPTYPYNPDGLESFYQALYENQPEDSFLYVLNYDVELKRLYKSISPKCLPQFHNYLLFLADKDLETIINALESFKFVEEKTLNGSSPKAKKILKNIRSENGKYLELVFSDFASRPQEIGFQKQIYGFNNISQTLENVKDTSEILKTGMEATMGATASVADAFKDCIDVSKAGIADLIDNGKQTMTDFSSKVNGMFDLIYPKLKEATNEDTMLGKILANVKEHFPSLIANVWQLMKTKDKSVMITSIMSIVGLLGISANVMEKLTGFAGGFQKQMSKTSMLLGMLASCLGDYSPSKLLTGNNRGLFAAQKEAEAIDTMHKLFMEVLEEWGLYETPTSATIKLLKSGLVDCINRCAQYEVEMVRCPAKYQRQTHYLAFMKDYDAVTEIKQQMTTGTYSQLKDTGFAAEVMQLFTRYNNLRKTIEQTRALDGTRIEPVAIAFAGLPGVGKSVLQGAFHKLLAARFKANQLDTNPAFEDLHDIDEWTSWAQNTQDQYHQGYSGQEIHLVDDLFQTADDSDHLDWCNMISPNKFPTRQADLASKGTPYISRLVVGSVNKFPTASKTIKQITALQRRFWVVHCQRIGRNPANVDYTFPHLRFTLYSSGMDYLNDHRRMPVTIPQLLDEVIRALKAKAEFYDRSQQWNFQADDEEQEDAEEGAADHVPRRIVVDEDLYAEIPIISNWQNTIVLENDFNGVNQQRNPLVTRQFYTAWRGLSLKFDEDNDVNIPAGTYKIADFVAMTAPQFDRLDALFELFPKHLVHETYTTHRRFMPLNHYTLITKSNGYYYCLKGTSWRKCQAGEEENIEESWMKWLLRQKLEAMLDPWVFLKKVMQYSLWYYVRFCDWICTPVTSVCDGIMILLGYLFGPGLFMEMLELFLRSFLCSAWIQMVFTFVPIAMLALYLKVQGVYLSTQTECQICKDALHHSWFALMPKKGTMDHTIFHRRYCIDHCQSGWFKTDHTETCKRLNDMQKNYQRMKCPHCVKNGGRCPEAGCHHSIPETEIDKREVLEYCEIAHRYNVLSEEDYQMVREQFNQDLENTGSSKKKKLVEELKKEFNLSEDKVDHLLQTLEDSDQSVKRKKLNKMTLKEFLRSEKPVDREGLSFSRFTIQPEEPPVANLVDLIVEEDSDNSLKKRKVPKMKLQFGKDGATMTEDEILSWKSIDNDPVIRQMALDNAAMDIHAVMKKSIFVRTHVKQGNSGGYTHGFGYKNYVIAPAHLNRGPGSMFWFDREIAGEKKEFAMKFETSIPSRDVALFSFEGPAFTDALERYLLLDDEVTTYVTKHPHGLQYIPSVDCFQLVNMQVVTEQTVKFTDGSSPTKYEKLIFITGLKVLSDTNVGAQTRNGDCGGHLLLLNKLCPHKLVGFHIIGSPGFAYSSLLTKELLEKLIRDSLPNQREMFISADHLETLDLKTTYPVVDLMSLAQFEKEQPIIPSMDDIDYIGDTEFRSKPAGESNIAPHILRNGFEEKTKPAALSIEDVKYPEKLEVNEYGYPDLLLTQMKKYAGEQEGFFSEELADMTDQLTEHFCNVLYDEDLSEMTEEEIFSGVLNDADSTPLDVSTSAGEPWQRVGKTSGKKKNAFLKREETSKGYRYTVDKTTYHGKLLSEVVEAKETFASHGLRTLSLWKNCLKDETRPNAKVDDGRTRLFTAAPLETVVLARKYFGKFKTAWQRHRRELFHSVGINPVSVEWRDLYERLKAKGQVGMDADFGSFDGRLRADFMKAAGQIVIDTILYVTSPQDEEYDLAEKEQIMQVIWNEFIETFHLSYSEIHLVKHGNPSGNPMTTVVNCIVNFLYHWHCYRVITGQISLGAFTDEVAFTCFGDDGIYSTNIASKYTFENVSKIMTEQLGQDYTTAAKNHDHSVKSVDDLMFLKRRFVKNGAIVMSPLEKDSIEQQFVWSKIQENDVSTVRTQIDEALIEAVQHGPIYFADFVHKLKRGIRALPYLQAGQLGIPSWKYSDQASNLIRRFDSGMLCKESGSTLL